MWQVLYCPELRTCAGMDPPIRIYIIYSYVNEALQRVVIRRVVCIICISIMCSMHWNSFRDHIHVDHAHLLSLLRISMSGQMLLHAAEY